MPLTWLPQRALLALAIAAAAGCSTVDKNAPAGDKAREAEAKAASSRPIANFSAGLRCMDSLLLDYGVRDLSVVAEDLAEQGNKAGGGTKDYLIGAVSEMTRRSRAIRLVTHGQDGGNGARREPSAAAAQYAVRGSISRLEDTIVRRNADGGLSVAPDLDRSYPGTASASVLGVDLSLLATRDNAVVPGVASRNQAILFKQGRGYYGEAEIRKFGINFALSTGAHDSQAQALRTLVELSSIEVFGRLAKVPYWSCLGVSDADEAVAAEVRDWYDTMAARPSEIVEYFQSQLRLRRIYDGPVDGTVNAQIKDSVGRYREALGLSREPKLSLDFFTAYLRANHHELQGKVQAVAAAATPPAGAEPVPIASDAPTVATALPAATQAPLSLRVASLNQGRALARGDAVQLNVKPSRSSHVYCFHQDENRKITRFFPNRFQQNSRVDATQGLRLPGAMRFEIRMNARGAQEAVSCFATDRDVLAELPATLARADFEPLAVSTLEQLRDAFVHVAGGGLAQDVFHFQAK